MVMLTASKNLRQPCLLTNMAHRQKDPERKHRPVLRRDARPGPDPRIPHGHPARWSDGAGAREVCADTVSWMGPTLPSC